MATTGQATALPFDSLNAWFDATMVPWMIANIPGYDPSGKAFFIPEAELIIEAVPSVEILQAGPLLCL